MDSADSAYRGTAALPTSGLERKHSSASAAGTANWYRTRLGESRHGAASPHLSARRSCAGALRVRNDTSTDVPRSTAVGQPGLEQPDASIIEVIRKPAHGVVTAGSTRRPRRWFPQSDEARVPAGSASVDVPDPRGRWKRASQNDQRRCTGRGRLLSSSVSRGPSLRDPWA